LSCTAVAKHKYTCQRLGRTLGASCAGSDADCADGLFCKDGARCVLSQGSICAAPVGEGNECDSDFVMTRPGCMPCHPGLQCIGFTSDGSSTPAAGTGASLGRCRKPCAKPSDCPCGGKADCVRPKGISSSVCCAPVDHSCARDQDCCGSADHCQQVSETSGEKVCKACRLDTQSCELDRDCCRAGRKCTQNRCACTALLEACDNDADCCGNYSCISIPNFGDPAKKKCYCGKTFSLDGCCPGPNGEPPVGCGPIFPRGSGSDSPGGSGSGSGSGPDCRTFGEACVLDSQCCGAGTSQLCHAGHCTSCAANGGTCARDPALGSPCCNGLKCIYDTGGQFGICSDKPDPITCNCPGTSCGDGDSCCQPGGKISPCPETGKDSHVCPPLPAGSAGISSCGP
jgi:hypothetical protein